MEPSKRGRFLQKFSVPSLLNKMQLQTLGLTQFLCCLFRYIVVFDPLDGSSNIDCGVSIGTVSPHLSIPRACCC